MVKYRDEKHDILHRLKGDHICSKLSHTMSYPNEISELWEIQGFELKIEWKSNS